MKALEEFHLEPDIISGVSAGAIIGSLYADGKTPVDILNFFKESNFFEFAKLVIPRRGLMSQHRMETALRHTYTHQKIEDLNLPFICNATDLVNGCNVYFRTGDLASRVMASSSFPIFVEPRIIDDIPYADGGLFHNLPSEVIRKKCHVLIGVHVNAPIKQEQVQTLRQIGERVYDLAIQSNTIDEMACCDLVIRPNKARQYGLFDIRNSQKIFDIGYEAAMKALQHWDERPI